MYDVIIAGGDVSQKALDAIQGINKELIEREVFSVQESSCQITRASQAG